MYYATIQLIEYTIISTVRCSIPPTARDHLNPSNPIQSTFRFGCFKPFYVVIKINQDRPSEKIWDHLRPLETDRNRPEQTRKDQNWPRLTGIDQDWPGLLLLDTFGYFWVLLGTFGYFWVHLHVHVFWDSWWWYSWIVVWQYYLMVTTTLNGLIRSSNGLLN